MRRTTRWTGLVAIAAALASATACGSSSKSSGSADTRGGTVGAPGVGSSGASAFGNGSSPGGLQTPSGTGSGASMAGAPAALPPEMQVKLDFELPQASDRFVYAANPKGGTVSIIDATTQNIQTIETGDKPTFLRTLAGTDDAIVLNVGSNDATVLRNPALGATTSTVPVVRGANAIAVAPDGKHAVVYFNASYSTAGAASGSFQDVTVLKLDPSGDTATGMTVGFSPRDVAFTSDGHAAYVVTDDGVSELDFPSIEKQGTGIARLISLGPNVDQKGLDVSITPDGHYAVTREPGKTVLRLVDLASGTIKSLDVADLLPQPDPEIDGGAPPVLMPDLSSVALAPNGAFALAVLRDQSKVLQIPVPGGFDDTGKVQTYGVDGELIGLATIAPAADRALLYTTVADVQRITVLTLDGTTAPKTVALRKTIQAVAIAPDGQTALIVHKKSPGDPNQVGITQDVQLARSFGYSVLRIPTGDVKLQVTATAPGSFTIVPDGSYLFLLFRDDPSGVREVQKVESKSFLVQPIQLGSPPISVGSVPKSKRLFVNQDHPDGRITFIDWDTNQTRTVTGFELNSKIRD